MLTRRVAPPAPRPAARRGAGASTSSRAPFVPRALLAKKGVTDPSGGRREDVYVGKGKWVKDDPRKYAARDDWFTGGWPGGEVGLKEGFARAELDAGASKKEMLPAGDVRRGRTPAVGATRISGDAKNLSDVDGPLEEDGASATARAVRAAKYALVKRLAALDRGVAADDDDRRAANALVEELERLAGEGGAEGSAFGSAEPGGKKSYAPTDDDLERALDGEWRLAYSSTFAGEAGGSQGFTGAPGAGAPGARLGSVYQRLSSERKTCDNVVRLGFGPQGASFTGEASLGHTYVVAGSTTRITFTGVTLESGAFGLPRVTLPTPLDALPEDAKEAAFGAGLQSGAFDTTFVDDDVRVSRGDRGETRVFVR